MVIPSMDEQDLSHACARLAQPAVFHTAETAEN
jgi:hypothetical protein